MKTIKVRYAPSPSGLLHIGSLKSILYNYYFAKKNNGKFFLRIEDTDKSKVTPESIRNIFRTLDLLNIEYEEEVLYQSKRLEIYKNYGLELINRGLAYFCQCKEKENINSEINRCNCNCSSGCIKIKIPENRKIEIKDGIYDEVTLSSKQIPNFVLIRADDTPTYNFAVVIDDHLMGISHVIRGVEHLLNSHKQYIIYEYFNWEKPNFIHFPVVIGEDCKKLSKTNKDISLEQILEEGIDIDALKTYVMSLGSNITYNDSIIEKFSIFDVKKSPTKFYMDILRKWSNKFLKRFSEQTRKNLFKFAKSRNFPIEKIDEILIKETAKRSFNYMQVIENLAFIFRDKNYSELLPINLVKEVLEDIKISNNFENYIKIEAEKEKILRKIITGKECGIGLIEIFNFLGKDNIIKRINIYIESKTKDTSSLDL